MTTLTLLNGVEVELQQELQSYIMNYQVYNISSIISVGDKDIEFCPKSYNYGLIYRELAEPYSDWEDEKIMSKLEELYWERKDLEYDYIDNEDYETRKRILIHKSQMITNAYALKHGAKIEQVITISHKFGEYVLDWGEDAIMKGVDADSAIIKSMYDSIFPLHTMKYLLQQEIKNIVNQKLIPLYGVVSSVNTIDGKGYRFDADDNTLLPKDIRKKHYVKVANLDDDPQENEKKKEVLYRVMHKLAGEGKNKKDIFHNIIVALYCLGYLSSIPTMVSVAKEFEIELRKFVKDKTKKTEKLIGTEEWKDIKNTIDPDDADEFEQTIKKYHDKGKIVPVHHEAPYFRHFEAFKKLFR